MLTLLSWQMLFCLCFGLYMPDILNGELTVVNSTQINSAESHTLRG